MIFKAINISKTFPFPQKTTLFSNLSLELEKGQSVAITGKSGVGKTTLLHIFGTLEEADSGEIHVAGQLLTPANGSKFRRKNIGFIFQSFHLLEDFTLLENVLMPALIARTPKKPDFGLHLLEQVGLADRAYFPAKLLSGGEKQRAAIARALCNDPDLILADEPSGNLDSSNAEKIGSLLLSIVEQHKKGLILVTHNPDLATLCQKHYSLAEGKLGISL